MKRPLLALLYAIRELQPIERSTLSNLIVGGHKKIPWELREYVTLGQSTSYAVIRRRLDTLIKQLEDAGLVVSKPYEKGVKLETSPVLIALQDILSLSLTHELNKSYKTIEVTPIFEPPLESGSTNNWARIFVAMPFEPTLLPVYTDHILKVTIALGVSCKRGDDFSTTNSIIHEVYSAIYHADLLIVDCTGKNANVFYELGMAHMMGKKAILIAQSRDDFPFDIQHLRSITYSNTPEGMQKFEAELEKTIRTELSL